MTAIVKTLLTSLLLSTAAPFPIDDVEPESSVPTPAARDANPIEFAHHLQELIERASLASAAGDHQRAARYYSALAKAVPDRATAFGKLCASLEAAGRIEEARAACSRALGLTGVTVEDFTRFVRLTLATPGKLSDAEVADVAGALQHLESQPGANAVSHHLSCELAVRVHDDKRLAACSSALKALAPGDPKTLYFQWTLAIRRGDQWQAERILEEARAAGLAAPALARMNEATAALSSTNSWGRPLLAGLAAAALAGLAWAMALRARRRRAAA